MARSSRHKLHRSHKHRDRSLSDDEDISKERKQKAEEEDTVRASRVSDQEKRRNSSKDVILASNGDVTSERGKKRKDIGDRWNGGGDKDVRKEKEMKKDELDVKSEKISKGKHVSSVSKNSDDVIEKVEEKRRTDKESSSFCKDVKEIEKVGEKEKLIGKEVGKKERGTTRVVEVYEDMQSREADKEKEKRYKRKVESGDYDKADDNREDHSKYRSHKDGKSKEKYRDELDRECRHYDKRRRDERSSRTHTSEKSDKYRRDETKITESHDKKSKFLDNEHDSSRYTENHTSKHKDSRGRKRSSDEICDQTEMKTRSAKEPRDDSVKYGSSSSRYDSRSDRVKVEQSDIEKAEPSLNSTRPKNSPKSAYPAKDQKWEKSGKTESSQRESLSADMHHQSSSAVRERISEVSSDKVKPKGNCRSDTSMPEADRTARSDTRTPQNHFTEKSSSMNERQPEDGGQKSQNTPTPNTPNHHPPPMAPNNSDRRTNSSRYRRAPSAAPWKGPGPAWPSPVGNGFMPMQHGPPLGFPHPNVAQFPPHQQLFRPPMDMISPPYAIHPYDMQMWDGSPGMFGEDPHMFGRQEWDQSRVLMGSRGWEMNKDGMWNVVQNGNVGMEYGAVPQKEIEYSHNGHARSERVPSDEGGSRVSREESLAQKEVRQLSKSVAEVTAAELPKMPSPQKNSEPKTENRVNYVSYYLSKIDILPELAHPDVYDQCVSLIEGTDVKSASHSVSMGQRKNNLSGFLPVAKSRQSLLPKRSDAIFEKSMSLYKSKVAGHMNGGKKENSNNMKDNSEDMGGVGMTEEEKNDITGADEKCDVEMSEKTENVVNPESFGVDISQILSTESTH